MNLKKTAALVVVIAIAFYYATPYITLYSLKKAADNNNTAKLEEYIDFVQIKDDFKNKMRSIISGGLAVRGEENNDQSGTIGALGQVIANALVEPLVNKLVTPEIVAAIIRGEKPQNGMNDINTAPAAPQENSEIVLAEPKTEEGAVTEPTAELKKKKRSVKIVPAYDGFNKFNIKIIDVNDADSEIIFVMKREKFIGWKIFKAEIPALDKIADRINKQLTEIKSVASPNTPAFAPATPVTPDVAKKNDAAESETKNQEINPEVKE